MKLKRWFGETHGVDFELVRHFVIRFFDSDLVTDPGQWTKVIAWAFALLAPAFFLITQALSKKYRYFSNLAVAEPYHHAVRADQLWLITLGMALVGLLTAIQWQSLFPSKLDYLTLGTLPIRKNKIFLAKFLALFLVISSAIFIANALPSFLFPTASMGRWAVNSSLPHYMETHAFICVLAGYFTFFSILAIQGLLLTLLPPSWFARVTNYLQGLAVALCLALIVLSFSISPKIEQIVVTPRLGNCLPPVWFLGVYQVWLGDQNPLYSQLANRAITGFVATLLLSLLFYLISYGRHRELSMEGVSRRGGENRQSSWLLDRLIPNARAQAALVFIAKTLARSGQHRGILMGYFGLSFAIVLTAVVEISAMMKPDRIQVASFAYAHMVLLLFLVTGLRHIFRIPVELRANWIFRATEREGRGNWLRAVDQFVIYSTLAVVIVLPAPLEVALLGWRGVEEMLLSTLAYLVLYEYLFYNWQKLPFTCSYLPGRENSVAIGLRALGVLTVLPMMNLIFVNCLYHPVPYTLLIFVLAVTWKVVRHSRRIVWNYTPLQYEEEQEPAVRSLSLGHC